MENYGDIILGFCSEEEKEILFTHVKEKCCNGLNVYAKCVQDTGEYYLSVPISEPDRNEGDTIRSPYYDDFEFQFEDVYAPENIICITYSASTQCFISNVDTEGCVYDDVPCKNTLYEIAMYNPYVGNEDNDMKVMKQLILLS